MAGYCSIFDADQYRADRTRIYDNALVSGGCRFVLRSKRLWRHTEPAFERAMEGSGLGVAKEKRNFANR